MFRRLWLPIVALALGCSFDTAGLGSGGGSGDSGSSGSSASSGGTTGDGDGTGTTSAGSETSDTTTTTSASSTGPTTSDSDTAGTSDGTTTGATGNPRIEISDGPTYDFGIVDVPMTGTHAFTVTNVGDDAATSVAIQALSSPFVISNDDCPAQLMPDESCTITVELSPMEFGEVSDTLTVDYGPDPDAATVDLEGAGGGSTGNLVTNGGGENNSSPPNGWTEAEGDTWYTPNFGQLPAHGGNRIIYPGEIDPLVFAELYQDIDLTPYATALAEGALLVDFSGWGISGFVDQDNYRFVVEFHDGSGVIGMPLLDTDWQLGNTWIEYTDSDTAPSTATFVRIRLRCELIGGVICDGGFDDVRLRVSYSP